MKVVDITCSMCGAVSPMLTYQHYGQYVLQIPDGWRWLIFDDRSNNAEEWEEIALCEECVGIWEEKG